MAERPIFPGLHHSEGQMNETERAECLGTPHSELLEGVFITLTNHLDIHGANLRFSGGLVQRQARSLMRYWRALYEEFDSADTAASNSLLDGIVITVSEDPDQNTLQINTASRVETASFKFRHIPIKDRAGRQINEVSVAEISSTVGAKNADQPQRSYEVQLYNGTLVSISQNTERPSALGDGSLKDTRMLDWKSSHQASYFQ